MRRATNGRPKPVPRHLGIFAIVRANPSMGECDDGRDRCLRPVRVLQSA